MAGHEHIGWWGAMTGLLLAAVVFLMGRPKPEPNADEAAVQHADEPRRSAHPRATLPSTQRGAPIAVPAPLTSAGQQALDRADWTGGAVVSCDLGHLAEGAHWAHVDAVRALELAGDADLLGRLGQPVEEGHLTFPVRSASGEARVQLLRQGYHAATSAQIYATGAAQIRVRWHGAEPGSVVGCTVAEAVPTGRVDLRLVDAQGDPLPEVGWWDEGWTLTIVRGCGQASLWFPGHPPLPVEAGPCTLHIENHHDDLPLLYTVGPDLTVEVPAGAYLEATLVAPYEPSLWPPPPLEQVAAAADLAAFTGAEQAADLLEQAVLDLSRGEWHAERTLALAQELRGP